MWKIPLGIFQFTKLKMMETATQNFLTANIVFKEYVILCT